MTDDYTADTLPEHLRCPEDRLAISPLASAIIVARCRKMARAAQEAKR
jgi:hypothetical protein